MADDNLVPLVLSTLRRAGWLAERMHAGTARGGLQHGARAGAPDVFAVRPAFPWIVCLPYLIECKAAKGRMRTAQLEYQKDCESKGIPYVVVRSADDIAKLVEEG
jgi:hypothetical protein